MKILIVSATEKEVTLFLQKTTQLKKTGVGIFEGNWGNLHVDFLITGVGLPSTVYQLTRRLIMNSYNLVVNVGIAGAFPESISIGSVVYVSSECFGDLGIDNKGEFCTVFEMGFADKNEPPFSGGKIINKLDVNKYESISSLPRVNAITVNKGSGEENDIAKKWMKFQPDIESMEGAGVFYVCQNLCIPFIEIRSVSNHVEARNPKKWNIPLALVNLNEVLTKLIIELESQS